MFVRYFKEIDYKTDIVYTECYCYCKFKKDENDEQTYIAEVRNEFDLIKEQYGNDLLKIYILGHMYQNC